MPSIALAALAALPLLTFTSAFNDPSANHTCPNPNAVCQSYGVDFQGGGTYFQNIASNASFTFVEEFSGCQPDRALNFLVDPNGDEYECTNVTMAGDLVAQLSTCPIEKSELTSGAWSILIESNNGNCGAIAYQRNFVLHVGEQITKTVTPTVRFTSTVTPIVNQTTSYTQTQTDTAVPVTVTSLKSLKHPTRTITPAAIKETITTVLNTTTLTRYDLLVANANRTKTAHCKLSAKQSTADPTASAVVTGSAAAGISAASAAAASDSSRTDSTKTSTKSKSRSSTSTSTSATAAVARRANSIAEILQDRAAFLAARDASIGHLLEKRAPDNKTVTTTITATSLYVTLTLTKTAKAVTDVSTILFNTTTTITSTYTELDAVKTTITLPVTTRTHTRTISRSTTWVTGTKTETVTLVTTYTPPAAAAKCSSKGGEMI